MDLDADKQAFVDAVMQPLGDDATQRDLLEECLAVAETYPRLVQGDRAELATRRMQETAASFKRRYRLGLWVPALLVLVAAWFTVIGPPALKSLDEVLLSNRITDSMGGGCCSHHGVPGFPRFGERPNNWEDEPALQRFTRRIDPAKRFMLLGDLSMAGEEARWKAVWDRYPEDPASFLAWAIKYQRVHKAWPADFVETGEKLDPGNGWFRFLAAASKIKSAVGDQPPPKFTREERRALGDKRYVPPPKPERAVLQPAIFAEAHAMLEQALAMPRWDDYLTKLDLIRFEAAPAATDFSEFVASEALAICQPEDWASGWMEVNSYRDAFTFAAQQAAKDGDREGLERLTGKLEQMQLRLASMPTELLPRIIARSVQIYAYRAFAKAWNDLGDAGKATPFEDAARDLDPKLHPPPVLPPDALDEHRGSGFVLEAYRGMRWPHSTAVTEPELRGGRLAEYAMYERFIVHVGEAFLFLVAIIVGRGIHRDRRVLGALPFRLTDLLRPSDHAAILVIGFVLPVAVYLLCTHSPWFAPRDTGLSQDTFILWLFQVISLGVAVILLSLHLARRRLGQRIPMLAMEAGAAGPTLWMGILALGMIPVAALLPRVIDSSEFVTMLCWTWAGFMAGMPLLWLINLGSHLVSGIPARRLHRTTLVCCLLWPVALLMVIGAASLPLLHAEERYWVARLDFEKPSPSNNQFNSRPERENADWINEETRRAVEGLR